MGSGRERRSFQSRTYPEKTKLLVKFVKGTPQVVTNFHLAQNCSCNSRLTSVYLLERNRWRSLWLLREVGTDRKRRKPPVRRQGDLHESGRDLMRCDSKRAQSLGERKTARNLEPNGVFFGLQRTPRVPSLVAQSQNVVCRAIKF